MPSSGRTLTIDNISLVLGVTVKDLHKFLLSKLKEIGHPEVHIVDLEIEKKQGSTGSCVTIEVQEVSMVDAVKKLDGFNCLGEKIRVRRVGEE